MIDLDFLFGIAIGFFSQSCKSMTSEHITIISQIKISGYLPLFASKLIIGLKFVIAKLNSYPVRAVNAKWVYVFLLLFSLSKRSMKSKSLFVDYTYSLYGKTVLLRPVKDFQLIPSYHNDQLILIEWISPLAASKIFRFLSFHRPYI